MMFRIRNAGRSLDIWRRRCWRVVIIGGLWIIWEGFRIISQGRRIIRWGIALDVCRGHFRDVILTDWGILIAGFRITGEGCRSIGKRCWIIGEGCKKCGVICERCRQTCLTKCGTTFQSVLQQTWIAGLNVPDTPITCTWPFTVPCSAKMTKHLKCDYLVLPENFAKFCTLVQQGSVHYCAIFG